MYKSLLPLAILLLTSSSLRAGAKSGEASKSAPDKLLFNANQHHFSTELIEQLIVAIESQTLDLAPAIAVEQWTPPETVRLSTPHASENLLKSNRALGLISLERTATGVHLRLKLSSNAQHWSADRSIDLVDEIALAETVAIIVRRALVESLAPDGREDPGERRLAEEQITDGESPWVGTSSTETTGARVNEVVPASPTLSRWAIASGYAITLRSGNVSPSHGFSLMSRLRLSGPLVAYLGYTQWGPLTYKDDVLELQARSHILDLRMGLSAFRGRWEGAISTGLMVDYVTRALDPASSNVELVKDGASVQVAAVLALGLRIRLVHRFGVFLSAGADLFIKRPVYAVRVDEGLQTVLNPWLVSPRGLMGLDMDIF